MTSSAAHPTPVRDETLGTIERIAREADAPEIAREASAVALRLDEGRFFVAVLGQFKRGKSTLINALAGASLLPTGVAPVTSVVTIVRNGARPSARVRMRDGDWSSVELDELVSYVAEEGNPQNKRGVVAVEVESHSPLLERGLCLVDTPGLGSVNAANTQETRDFLPHVDAAMLVVGADPPITGEEARLLAGLGASVRDLFVVIAKADRVSASELTDACGFTTKVISETLPGRTVPIFQVSAKEMLASDLPTRDWSKLVAALSELALGSGSALVEAARRREVATLAASLRRHIDEAHGALLRPVAETERRIAKLQRAADDAERALTELRYLFDAEQKQIERRLESDGAAFVVAMLPELIAALPPQTGRAALFAVAQDICEQRIRAWRDEVRPRVEREFSAAADRFATAAEAVTTKVRTSSPESELPETLAIDTALRARSRFYFAQLNVEADPPWWTRLADVLRSPPRRDRAAHAAASTFLIRLAEANAHGVVGDYVDRIVESRRWIERAVRDALRGAATAATSAAARAERLRARGQAAVVDEATRLVALRRELQSISESGAKGSE